MTLFNVLLGMHIFFGSVSLLLGAFILLTKKGDKRHKLAGMIYFYAMLLTAMLAIVMTYLNPNVFLFITAVFTAYMILSGKRYLNKRSTDDVSMIDWLLTVAMCLFGLVFVTLGILNVVQSNFFGIVLIVFGGISMMFVYDDYINFTGKSTVKNYWLITHLQRMVGSYIAASTAFLVVNNTLLPGVVAWLLPTVLFVPLIIKWSTKFQINKK
jgi:uncharacterized membrane protein